VLLVDSPHGPVHCVYKRDAILVAPLAVADAFTSPRLDLDCLSNAGDTYGCSTCHREVAHEKQLRQRLNWADAGYSEEVLAFTRLLPLGGVVDAIEDGILSIAHVGNWMFSLRNVRCAGCLTQLGWHLASLHQDQPRSDDDAVERCPVAPELVGRFLLVRDAISHRRLVLAVDAALCVVDSDCNPPSSLQIPSASLVT
jgi:hypothetical protein